MSKFTMQQFLEETAQEDKGHGLFELETERFLEVNLNGEVWTKMGSMISYRGNIKFEREGMMGHGFGKFLKKAFSGEGAMLTKATGQGKVYLAEGGKKITVIQLDGSQALCVNGNDLLAFEPSVQWDIKMMKSISGMMAGGLFNVRLEGSGMVAITTHHQPLTLRVTPDSPVTTDPNATVAWSGNLEPQFKTDVSLKTFLGRGSGESFQMQFQGDGFVVVQPYEEIYFQQQG